MSMMTQSGISNDLRNDLARKSTPPQAIGSTKSEVHFELDTVTVMGVYDRFEAVRMSACVLARWFR